MSHLPGWFASALQGVSVNQRGEKGFLTIKESSSKIDADVSVP